MSKEEKDLPKREVRMKRKFDVNEAGEEKKIDNEQMENEGDDDEGEDENELNQFIVSVRSQEVEEKKSNVDEMEETNTNEEIQKESKQGDSKEINNSPPHLEVVHKDVKHVEGVEKEVKTTDGDNEEVPDLDVVVNRAVAQASKDEPADVEIGDEENQPIITTTVVVSPIQMVSEFYFTIT